MDIVNKFAGMVGRRLEKDPESARKLLSFGYKAFQAGQKIFPDKRLNASQRYVADSVMNVMLKALRHPDRTAMCSLFVPGELLCAAGLTPYSVEALSSYLAGTQMEKQFLDVTGEYGIPETMCSFHRIFLGAMDSGLMPKPPFLLYTNLACDANMMTFPYLRQKYGIPGCFIEVPYEKNEDAVQDVARQLREAAVFIEDITRRRIPESSLKDAVRRAGQSSANYHRQLELLQNAHTPTVMTYDMYAVFMSRILMGTAETLRYTEMLKNDAVKAASQSPGHPLRIVWVHMMPFMQPALRECLNFSEDVYFTANDLTYDGFTECDAEDPYENMAARMVHSVFNGSADMRIRNTVRMVRETNAEGVIVFAHWGCKSTIGASTLIRDALAEEGVPALVLDGDGCDPGNNSEGQMMTRIEAFMEMLKRNRG